MESLSQRFSHGLVNFCHHICHLCLDSVHTQAIRVQPVPGVLSSLMKQALSGCSQKRLLLQPRPCHWAASFCHLALPWDGSLSSLGKGGICDIPSPRLLGGINVTGGVYHPAVVRGRAWEGVAPAIIGVMLETTRRTLASTNGASDRSPGCSGISA